MKSPRWLRDGRSIQNAPEHVEVSSVYADRTVLCFDDAPRVGLVNHGEASARIEGYGFPRTIFLRVNFLSENLAR